MKKWIPNIITSIRLVAAIVLIFLVPFSLPFMIVYGVSGLSDAVDGFLARKLKVQSQVGSVLDSVADWLFLLVMSIKIFPTLVAILNWSHWLVIIVCIVLHINGYILCFLKFKKFSAVHTYANKVQSALIFMFPFFLLGQIELLYSLYIYIGGFFCFYSAVEINLIHIFAKEYNEDNKTIFFVKKNNNPEPLEENNIPTI